MVDAAAAAAVRVRRGAAGRRWAVVVATVAALAAACAPPPVPPGDGLAGPPTVTPTVLPSGALAYTGVRYGTVAGPQVLDLYRPAGPGPHPLVVWFHGGYWTQGSRSQLPVGMRDQLLAAGYAVATAGYRLSELAANKWPVQVLDAKLAVKYLQANAGALALDADRTVTSGFSAGGHLALLVAVARSAPGQSLTGGDPQVRGAFTFGAPIDLELARSTNPVADAAVRLLLGCGVDGFCGSTALEPWRYLDRFDGPLLLVTGGADVVVPDAHAELMASTADEVGYGALSRVVVPGAGHDGLDAATPPSAYLPWLDALL